MLLLAPLQLALSLSGESCLNLALLEVQQIKMKNHEILSEILKRERAQRGPELSLGS